MLEAIAAVSVIIVACLCGYFDRPILKPRKQAKNVVSAPTEHRRVSKLIADRTRRLRKLGYDEPTPRECYEKYLASKTWEAIKQKVFNSRSWLCMACGKKSKLTVHHCSYRRVGGSERMADLILLCHEHHANAHKIEHVTGDLLRAHQVLWRQRKRQGLRVGPWC